MARPTAASRFFDDFTELTRSFNTFSKLFSFTGGGCFSDEAAGLGSEEGTAGKDGMFMTVLLVFYLSYDRIIIDGV
jgi:hypothetical protein